MFKVGSHVLYAPEPLLYGPMVVRRFVARDFRECGSVYRGQAWPKNLYEVFHVSELEPVVFDAGDPDEADNIVRGQE